MQLNDYRLWTALVTPFNEDLTVDYTSLAKLLKEQDEAGNGLLILGSTGEALNIDLATKKAIVEFVQTQNLNVPLMIGVGGHQYQATHNWVKWLETQNVAAYLMVTPIYAKPGDMGQYHWFKGLMDEASRPVMLYNVPGRTGKELSYRAVSMLNSHRNFWAIKEASGSVLKFKEYLRAANGAPVFCGDDGLMPDFALAGSHGLVSVASNTWPKETNLYVEKCVAEKFDAKELWTKAANSLFIASNPIPAKRILKNEGRIAHDTMMPPLCAEDLQSDALLTESCKAVRDWYQREK